MKKLYAFVAVAMFSATAYSQTTLLTDDFASASAGNNTSSSGSSSGWTGDANFPTVVNAFQAGGMVKLGTGSATGSITSKTLDLSTDGGAFTLSFDVKGWTAVEGDIIVKITGMADQTVKYTSVMAGSPQKITLDYTGGQPNSTITLATSAKRAYLDNVSVVTKPTTLAVIDAKDKKVNLVKSTVVDSSLNFGVKADVKIYDMNGRMVKTATVNDGTAVDVSSLAKGVYIVAGEVEGQKVTQKIIKK